MFYKVLCYVSGFTMFVSILQNDWDNASKMAMWMVIFTLLADVQELKNNRS